MLIDIFARRYEMTTVRNSFEQRDSRLLVQAFRILSEDIYPHYCNGKEDVRGVKFWTDIHSRLSRELGVEELSKQWFSYNTKWNGSDHWQSHKHPMVTVCQNWMNETVKGSADIHIKERLSLVELGFRERENEVNSMNLQPISPPQKPVPSLVGGHSFSMVVPGDARARIEQIRAERTAGFRTQVDELNARFRQAHYNLHYHNGFIQASTDALVQEAVETPFWSLVSAPQWANVDLDMKEALDRRDSDGRDPAFYAARALESAIKIISGVRGWTHGKEKGAHNFIDNLGAKTNAFIAPWEASTLKDFFTHVRNPFSHGAGSEQMPSLTRQQTEWAIEFSMSWIKSLIRRM
jgi:hypothetical protein